MERNGKSREFRPSAEGKWDVLVSSTMQVSVGDQIRVTGGFREGSGRQSRIVPYNGIRAYQYYLDGWKVNDC